MKVLYLDIETSWNHDDKNPITWMTSCNINDGGTVIQFRYPEEVADYYSSIEDSTLTFIHRMQYDFSYLKPYLDTIGEAEYLQKDQHDYYTYKVGHHEFRDSYKLANCSLEEWGRIYSIVHKKLVGAYDYDKIIYQDTPLTDAEKEYDKIDVIALQECMDNELMYHGKTYKNVPLTSTGYVREELLKSCRTDKAYRDKYFRPIDTLLYRLALQSYSGGYTHLNRHYGGIVVEGDIVHRDFTSNYPSELKIHKYPFGNASRAYNIKTIEDALYACRDEEYSVLIELDITKATLKDDAISMPIMQECKMLSVKPGRYLQVDNGRIIQTDYHFIYHVDNIRLKWIYEQYDLEYTVVKAYLIKNEPIPTCISDVIDRYFILKQELKEEYKRTGDPLVKIELDVAKKMLNAIYGCMCQNPLKYGTGLDLVKCLKSDKELVEEVYRYTTEELDKYFKSRSHFLSYLMGIYVTAYAMDELFEYVELIGYDHVIYCDTDSIFYISTPELERKIDALNKSKKKVYVTMRDGRKVYYDDFIVEERCKAFKGLHSKCYAVITEDETLRATIAGVPEKARVIGTEVTREDELRGFKKSTSYEDELQALNRLDNGFTFRVCTGTYSTYVEHEPMIINIDGHEIHTAGGCIVRKLEEKKIAVLDGDV